MKSCYNLLLVKEAMFLAIELILPHRPANSTQRLYTVHLYRFQSLPASTEQVYRIERRASSFSLSQVLPQKIAARCDLRSFIFCVSPF